MKVKNIFLTVLFVLFGSNLVTNNISIKPNTSFKDNITYISLYHTIVSYGIKYPDIAFAQAIIESGHFTSELFKESNNLFGMKFPKKRETVAMNADNSEFSHYSHWKESVYDYKLWQESNIRANFNISKEDYLKLIGERYAEDKDYLRKIRSIIDII